MAFPALLDTNVLFSATLNDTMLRLAEEGAFHPLWSADILTELATVLVREADLSASAAERRVAQMRAAFPAAEVFDDSALVGVMTCHPKDRHVLAAAVRGHAQVLVTFNLEDFPEQSVEAYDLTVVSPDAFLLDQLDLHPAKVGWALAGQITEARRPPLTMGELLDRLGRAGVPAFAAQARRHEFA